MSNVTTRLLEAVFSKVDGTAAITALVSDYGFGMGDKGDSSYLGWVILPTGDETDFLSPGTDHYTEIPIQFMASSSNESQANVIGIIEEVGEAFRNTPLTLDSGARWVQTLMGSVNTIQQPEGDGWQCTQVITFTVGTA